MSSFHPVDASYVVMSSNAEMFPLHSSLRLLYQLLCLAKDDHLTMACTFFYHVCVMIILKRVIYKIVCFIYMISNVYCEMQA